MIIAIFILFVNNFLFQLLFYLLTLFFFCTVEPLLDFLFVKYYFLNVNCNNNFFNLKEQIKNTFDILVNEEVEQLLLDK